MENAVASDTGKNLKKNLKKLQDLLGKRDGLQEMLRKAAAEKASVTDAIYQRVCSGYEEQIRELAKAIEPLQNEFRQTREQVAAKLGELESKAKSVEDKIAELAFRHRVGEYDDQELARAQAPLEAQTQEMAGDRDRLSKTIEEIDAALQEDGGAPATAPAKPAEEPVPTPSTPGPSEANAEPPSDIVDPNDWMKEFQQEGEKVRPNRRATDIPNPAQALVEVADPLADLADPSIETPSHTRQASAPAAQGVGVTTDEAPRGVPALVITQGTGAGKKLPLAPMTMTVGREHDNNIELKDEDVARYHARISFQRGQYILQDLESSSGTWVNGVKITEVPLRHGDKIRVGSTEMMIHYE